MFEHELAAQSTAPRVTQADVDAAITGEHYFTALEGVIGGEMTAGQTIGEIKDHAALELLTICVLVLRNGYTVTGTSACASPENFDADTGRRLAREHAVRQVWPLLGYTLKDRLAAQAEFLAI